MAGKTLLGQHQILRTRDPDELLARMEPLFAVRQLEMPDAGRDFDCVLNHLPLHGISLTYARYGAPFTADVSQMSSFMQGFPVSGAGTVVWNGRKRSVNQRDGGIACDPGRDGRFRYDQNFSHLILKISPEALTRRLSLLLDQPIDPPLSLDGTVDPKRSAAQRRLVMFLAKEMSRRDRLPELALREIEDAIIINFLYCNGHNYSARLKGALHAATPTSWHVRRAQEYMQQYWTEPLTIEMLAQVASTSVRNLFVQFHRATGVSPMVWLAQHRLRQARRLLTAAEPGTTVTGVGCVCGFSNMGNFAARYRAAFGERPSETLRFALKSRLS